jgi:hypothetical protein
MGKTYFVARMSTGVVGGATDAEGRFGVAGCAGVAAAVGRAVGSVATATVLVRTLVAGAGAGPDGLLDSDRSKAPVAVSTISPLPATTKAADRKTTQRDRLTGTKSC